MKKIKENIILGVKGFIMGIANIIPGVSGGTLALTLGIYERFIGAISHFFSNLKENIKFLLPIAIGLCLAILSMSRVIDYSYEHFPIPTTLFFVGLVIGGIPMLYHKVKGKKEGKQISSWTILLMTFSLVIVMAFADQLFGTTAKVNLSGLDLWGYIILFFVGMIAAATMVIPGVSGSLVLMLLGYYYPILKVVKSLTKFENLGENIMIAGIFGVGVLVGIVLISKIIEFLLKKFETKTYYGVLGFIFASILAIPISTYNEVENLVFSVPQILIGIIFMAIGGLIAYKLGDE
ncbi:MAG TPA: DUF368 domain-containing protein [Candidatus Fimihabitans intestinipullorum]|uniref:DUF368 domain-containing protein n=1 Tax=Candidatus Fimihabitans intestinipullorum TaxID=2840820 RepID=A0A9D1HWI0_9BACT|nr:DUF368 domain-containing protein [Candidatus Fimihabitans intestinipullorum]